MNQIYISAEGYVIPCCWIGNEPSMREYRKLHAGYLDELNIKTRPLDDILRDTRYLKIESSWQTDSPYSHCREVCSKPLLLKNKNAQGTNEARSLELNLKRPKNPQGEKNPMLENSQLPKIIPAYWNTSPELNQNWSEGLKIFYDRISFDEGDHPPRVMGENIDKILQEAAAHKEYSWTVVFGVGTVFASQLKIVAETIDFISSIKEKVLVCGHLMNKPGFYCGLHEQFLIVNLDVYRELGHPEFGDYIKVQKTLPNYEAGPSIHENYTPTYISPASGRSEYTTKVCGWGFVEASLNAGLRILNFSPGVRESKVFIYPADEIEKLNRNIQRFLDWEDLQNPSQRAIFAHLFMKKLGLHQSNRRGSFGFAERTNCLFFFNTQLLLPDDEQLSRGRGPISQYSGPCSGFQDLAFLKHYGFTPETELVYFDINPKALEMKQYILDNFDGNISTIDALYKSICKQYPDEEIYGGNLFYNTLKLLEAFKGNERDLRDTWLQMKQLKRKFIKLNLLFEPEALFEHLDSDKKILLNVTDIFLGQNELLYGLAGVQKKFDDFVKRSRDFPELMLTGTNIQQDIFLDFAKNIN